MSSKNVARAQVDWCLSFWRIWYLLLQTLTIISDEQSRVISIHTSFSNTHLFNLRSSDLQFHSCWLWFSRHCQWVRNCVRQFSLMSLILPHLSVLKPPCSIQHKHIHARRTPSDFAALLHAVKLAPAIGLGLAHHVVIVVILAPRANEVRGTEQRRRTGSKLFDLGDVVG